MLIGETLFMEVTDMTKYQTAVASNKNILAGLSSN